MLMKAFVERIGTCPKVAAANVVLVANALIWYFYVFNFLMEVIEGAGLFNFEILLVWGTNFLGIALSAVVGSFLIYRLKRRVPFLLYWMLAGAILSLTPIIFNITELPVLTIFSVLVGVYFGLGMPVCMGYYTAATEAGNRSRLGGITFLSIFLGFFLLSNIATTDIAFNAASLQHAKLLVWHFCYF